MPVISKFYGILIKMYFNEHGIPHFHWETKSIIKLSGLE